MGPAHEIYLCPYPDPCLGLDLDPSHGLLECLPVLGIMTMLPRYVQNRNTLRIHSGPLRVVCILPLRYPLMYHPHVDLVWGYVSFPLKTVEHLGTMDDGQLKVGVGGFYIVGVSPLHLYN